MKLILREQQGTKRFVFAQRADGRLITCPMVLLLLLALVEVFSFPFLADSPPTTLQFVLFLTINFGLLFFYSFLPKWVPDHKR